MHSTPREPFTQVSLYLSYTQELPLGAKRSILLCLAQMNSVNTWSPQTITAEMPLKFELVDKTTSGLSLVSEFLSKDPL